MTRTPRDWRQLAEAARKETGPRRLLEVIEELSPEKKTEEQIQDKTNRYDKFEVAIRTLSRLNRKPVGSDCSVRHMSEIVEDNRLAISAWRDIYAYWRVEFPEPPCELLVQSATPQSKEDLFDLMVKHKRYLDFLGKPSIRRKRVVKVTPTDE